VVSLIAVFSGGHHQSTSGHCRQCPNSVHGNSRSKAVISVEAAYALLDCGVAGFDLTVMPLEGRCFRGGRNPPLELEVFCYGLDGLVVRRRLVCPWTLPATARTAAPSVTGALKRASFTHRMETLTNSVHRELTDDDFAWNASRR
jgi:hypothetical protein